METGSAGKTALNSGMGSESSQQTHGVQAGGGGQKQKS